VRHGFHSEAWDEFVAAIAWHDAREEGTGREFARAVAKKLEQLDRFPASAPLYLGLPKRFDIRKMGVSGWPYSLVTATLGDERIVIAVSHEKRKPGYWRHRLKK
jgi:toxin ParE1/3/4